MKRIRAALYARVSTQDQQTLKMQINEMRRYCRNRNWEIVLEVQEIGSGANAERKKRAELLVAARRQKLDVIVVWKLDRWGRSLLDLIHTLQELQELNIGFVSITEALDLTTPIGRAMAGMLGVFAEFERELLCERIKAGIAQAKKDGKHCGRPKTAALLGDQIRGLKCQGFSHSQIARKLKIGRTSVRRVLLSSGETI